MIDEYRLALVQLDAAIRQNDYELKIADRRRAHCRKDSLASQMTRFTRTTDPEILVKDSAFSISRCLRCYTGL